MLGGYVGSSVLRMLTRVVGPEQVPPGDIDARASSKLGRLFGPAVYERLAGKTVVDFGSGRGGDAVHIATRGAGHVFGVEIREDYVEEARLLAAAQGVAARCSFVNPLRDRAAYESLYGCCDVVVSVDAFEHFDDPAEALREMYRLLTPGGSLLISFGPPWLHPYGAHMGHVNRMPWLHFLFRESTILAAENRGALRFEESSSGPNRMTVRRFERIAAASEFELLHIRALPVWGLWWFARNVWTREYFTSVVNCEMTKGARAYSPG